MAELCGDHAHRHPIHGEMRAVGMAQDVEVYCGRDPGPRACLLERTLLVRRTPSLAVGTEEDQIGRGAIGGPVLERGLGPLSQDDMSHLALAEPDRHRAAVGVEVAALEASELGIAASGQQRRLHQPMRQASMML
jgi:hypothetical protein